MQSTEGGAVTRYYDPLVKFPLTVSSNFVRFPEHVLHPHPLVPVMDVVAEDEEDEIDVY